ncbi:MAG: alpha/beta hydrolase [Eubacteriales bacterium]|nr:alpha/beta hydrolase [Eubacteriales bacterium]
MQKEFIVLSEERNVTLTAYLEETGGEFRGIDRRPAILVLPGGGYQMCSDREADPVAFPYLKAGYQVFILRYSIQKNAVWPRPLQDYDEAMDLIRSKADEWHLFADKIAVIGFSAGGHLAGAAATMAKNRPAAAILGYAVLNQDVKGCNPTAPSLIDQVDDQTCPCFLFASRTDNLVPISNSLEFMQALDDHAISFESHIYAYGPHGFSTCDSSVQDKDTVMCSRIPQWVEDSLGWLKDVLGDFSAQGMTEPVCSRFVSGDKEAFLSVDCTIGHLMANAKAQELLKSLMEGMAGAAGADNSGQSVTQGMDPEAVQAMAGKMKLRDALAYGNLPEEKVEQLDEILRRIPNE